MPIPPKRGDKGPALRARVGEQDEQILVHWREGEGAWKKTSGYHIRFLVETTFSRRQVLFRGRLMSRLPVRQLQEVAIGVRLMNEHASRSLA